MSLTLNNNNNIISNEEEEEEIELKSNENNTSSSTSSLSPSPSSSPSLPSSNLTYSESIKRSQLLKELGNNSFKENSLIEAKKYYEEGIQLLKVFKNKDLNELNEEIITNELNEEFNTLYLTLYSNKSMVLFKEENWLEVIINTNEVLNNEPDNIKALYRRSVALHRTGNYEESKNGLNRVITLDPNNAAAKKELNTVLKTIKEQKEKEKNAMSSIFSKGSMYNDREEERQRKLRRAKEEEERLHDEYIQDKLKKRNEGLSDSEVNISFEDWKTAKKKKDEEIKKNEEKLKEEERKKRNSENKTRKKQKTTTNSSESNNGLEYDEEER